MVIANRILHCELGLADATHATDGLQHRLPHRARGLHRRVGEGALDWKEGVEERIELDPSAGEGRVSTYLGR